MSRPRTPGQAGFTLIEQLVALGVLGMAFLGILQTVSFMQFENRSGSQRMLAVSLQNEILELFKALPYDQITYPVAGSPVYLKKLASGAGNPRWIVPAQNAWQTVPVDDLNSASASDPAQVANKLPGAIWKVDFATDATDATLRQVTVTMQWRLYAGGTRPPVTMKVSTIVCQSYPNL